MIVCHCNVITRQQIEEVVDRLLADDPYAVITPGRIYHRLGKRGRCCNCFPLVVQILVERVDAKRDGECAGAGADADETLENVA